MSHALLLRLFLAPSFFSVHVALQYLRHYSDNIGITYYLTRRLKELDTHELRDVWGFICHLLVTRPSRSRALECFVVDIAHRSTHIAMLTFWFMQASLKDLAQNPDSQSFHICQRVLHECHEIIFGDLPSTSSTPYSTLRIPFFSRFSRKKVKAHMQPTIVGIGMVLAGVPGLPRLTDIMGNVAIEQGRIDEEGSETRSLEPANPVTTPATSSLNLKDEEEDEEEDDSDDDSDEPDQPSTSQVTPGTEAQNALQPNQRSGPSRRKTMGPSQTSPALPLHLARKPRLSYDPFGQLDTQPQAAGTAAFQSTPSVPSTRQHRAGNLSEADILLQRYDTKSQMHLLRSHFCRSEVQFILTLENISNRLLVVPKLARVSALRAELTALNHMLPAEVCLPLWCSSSDTPQVNGVPQAHHRIIRIPPGECVVLNSAERAPYLLMLEIIHGDLDFDPRKRNNKEILRKMAVKESEKAGASRDIVPFNATSTTTPTIAARRLGAHNSRNNTSEDSNGFDQGFRITSLDQARPQPTIAAVMPPTPVSSTILPPEDNEEMDLVEQLYGTDESIRARPIDLSESIVLPTVPKNRDLDLVTWSRSTSAGPSTPFPATDLGQQAMDGMQSPYPPGSSIMNGSSFPMNAISLSLDDYSERMRTAAVMLAQLNANLVQAVAPANSGNSNQDASYSGNSRSWLPGSSWLGGAITVEQPDANRGSASLEQQHPSTTSTRLRLQYSEAAAIRDRIMKEMLALEEERMERTRENRDGSGAAFMRMNSGGDMNSAEDESIIRKELNKIDPSAVVFSESWATKKSRIRQGSPYGHLANWDCVSVIVKTGGDLRQEQLAVQLIQEFERIWREEGCQCWVRYFRILITGGSSGLVETITDAVSIHSIKKAEYARRLTQGRLGHVTLLDHFKTTYGDPTSAKFARAQRNFAKSLAGCSLVTYLLQIKDRHNGNILLDREGHLVHIDFGFMLSNSPGNMGFEAAPFKLPLEYVEVLGGVTSEPFQEFKRLFRDGFEAARKHCDRIVTMVELMQKDSTMPCFAALGDQTANQLRTRFQQGLTHSLVLEHVERLIEASLGSSWTRLYDSYQYYSQSIL